MRWPARCCSTPLTSQCATQPSRRLGPAPPPLAAACRRLLAAACFAHTPSSLCAQFGPGRATYRPSSYSELVTDAVAAIATAVGDGLTRLEVEFPAVSNVDGALLVGLSETFKTAYVVVLPLSGC